MEEALDWQGETWQKMSEACQDKHRNLVEDPKLVADNRAFLRHPGKTCNLAT